MHELAQSVNQVLETLDSGRCYEVSRLQVTGERVRDGAAVKDALEARRQWRGWVCCQSAVVVFPAESLPDDAGLPLSAELVSGDESLHLLPDGAGGWTLTTLREGEGEEVLVDEVRHLARDATLGALTYRRFWKRQEHGGLSPVAARLAGFSEVE